MPARCTAGAEQARGIQKGMDWEEGGQEWEPILKDGRGKRPMEVKKWIAEGLEDARKLRGAG